MRGQVLGVDTRTGDGMVAGDDGRRYSFGPGDWADRGEPAVGMYVDFEFDQKRARFAALGFTAKPTCGQREPECLKTTDCVEKVSARIFEHRSRRNSSKSFSDLHHPALLIGRFCKNLELFCATTGRQPDRLRKGEFFKTIGKKRTLAAPCDRGCEQRIVTANKLPSLLS